MRVTQGKKLFGLSLVAGLLGLSACFFLPSAEDGGAAGDLQAPVAAITAPADGFATNLTTLVVTGTAADLNTVTSVMVFGCRDGATPDRDDPCYPQRLTAGMKVGTQMTAVLATSLTGDWDSWEATINFYDTGSSAQDYAVRVGTMDDRGNFNKDAASITVTVGGPDTFGPEVTVIAPLAGQTVRVDTIPVVGKALDTSISSITVDPGTGPVPAESLYGSTLDVWRVQVPLAMGGNTLTIVATDSLANTSTTQLHVVREVPNSNMAFITTPLPVTLGYSAGTTAEQPEHLVSLDPYYLDIYEVSLEDYMLCYYTLFDPLDIFSHTCWLVGTEDLVLEDIMIPKDSPKNLFGYTVWDQLIYPLPYPLPGRGKYPLRDIDKFNAEFNFCPWNGGKRLPTEAEWERAARAGAGANNEPDGRLNPLGGNTVDCATANVLGCIGHVLAVDDPIYGANPLGVYHLAGNVMEWVQDFYQDDYYSVLKPLEPVLNPLMDVEANSTCLYGSWDCIVNRGGSYTSSSQVARSTFRNYYDDPWQIGMNYMIGFRCAADGP